MTKAFVWEIPSPHALENDAKLVFMQQHLAKCAYSKRKPKVPTFPSLNQYTFVVDLFCGDTHFASFHRITSSVGQCVSIDSTWHDLELAQKLITDIASIELLELGSNGVCLCVDSSDMVKKLTCNIAAVRRSDYKTVILCHSVNVDVSTVLYDDEARAICEATDVQIEFQYQKVFPHIHDTYMLQPNLHVNMMDVSASTFEFFIESVDEDGVASYVDIPKLLFLEMTMPFFDV